MTPLTEQFQANLSDGDLLSAFLQNPQQGAFAVIVRRHGGMVLGVCRSVLRNESDAEDAAQAVFLTLAQRASSLGGHRMLVGWLHRVAWYVASNAARAAAIRHRHEQEAARMKPESGAITEMTEVDVIHAELNRLSDKYRTPLLLHHLEGRTQEETASLLGCTVGAVSVRLTRGRQMLRERLVRRGVADSPVGVAAVLASQASAGVLPAFVTSANQTAVAVLAGKAATTAVSASVATLSKGALKMLFWAKMKLVAGLTTAFLLLGGAGLGTYMAIADGGTAPPTPGQARPMAEATTMAASQPKGWVAFEKEGVEFLDCVQVNAGECRAKVVLLPDGSVVRRLEGLIPAAREDVALEEMVAQAPGMAKGTNMGNLLTAEQWQQFAQIMAALRDREATNSSGVQAIPHPFAPRTTGVVWQVENPTGTEAVASFAQMEKWLLLPPGPDRVAAQAGLVEAVRKATSRQHLEACRQFKDRVARARELLTEAQRAQLKQMYPDFPAQIPAAKAWKYPDQRGDGVYDGRALLASYRQIDHGMNLKVTYGSALALTLPAGNDVWLGSSTTMQFGVSPEFLAGDATLNVTIGTVREKNVRPGQDRKAELDGVWLLRRCLAKKIDLADLGVSKEQVAQIGELHKQAVEMEKAANERARQARDKVVADLKKKLQNQGVDGATIESRIAGVSAGTAAPGPTLQLDSDEVQQLRARIADWWEVRQNRDEASAALLAQMKAIVEPKIKACHEYETLWTQMGAVLTKEQKQEMHNTLRSEPGE